MAVAINEQIVEKIKARLLLISEASGYETTVEGDVIRPPRIWDGHLQDYQIIVLQGQLTRNEALSYAGNPPATAWNMPLTVFGECRPSDSSTIPIDTLLNEFAADAIRAICTPVHSWHNWDGLAINTEIESVENFNAEDGAGFKLVFNVIYRVSETNPYELRG